MTARNLALFDIDKTIYDGYVIFPLAEYQLKKGVIDKNTLDNLYKDLQFYKEKKVDYETTVENLNLHWIEGLKNKPIQMLIKETESFLQTQEGNKFFPFSEPLISLLNKTHDIYFVTGELQFIGQGVTNYFKVKGYISAEVGVKDGNITDNLITSLSKRESKRQAIEHLFEKYSYQCSYAFGDSEGDIEMLERVENAFCINATDGLKKIAAEKKWNIVSPDTILNNVQLKLNTC